MKTELHPCFLLHTRPYRETSLLLDVLSAHYGRVNLVARGVKRGNNNLGLLLQPGRKLNISWSSKGELGTMMSAEINGPGYKLSGTRLISCFYMNELLVRTLHRHESHPELFQIYETSLSKINEGAPEDRVLRIFEKHLLSSLGYGLILDHEVDTGDKINADATYYYQMDYGPVRQKPENFRNFPITGKTLVALDSEDNWNADISREAKALLRMILAAYTGDKPIASRALYKAYLQQSLPV